MRVSFYTFNSNSLSFKQKNDNKSSVMKRQRCGLNGNLRMSVGVGLAMGSMAAGILKYKKIPNVFASSLEFGTVFSYLTYMGSLIATPFKEG